MGAIDAVCLKAWRAWCWGIENGESVRSASPGGVVLRRQPQAGVLAGGSALRGPHGHLTPLDRWILHTRPVQNVCDDDHQTMDRLSSQCAGRLENRGFVFHFFFRIIEWFEYWNTVRLKKIILLVKYFFLLIKIFIWFKYGNVRFESNHIIWDLFSNIFYDAI